MNIVLDIETVPLYNPEEPPDFCIKYLPSIDARLKDPAKIEAAQEVLVGDRIKAMSCDPDLGKIVAIGTINRLNGMHQECFYGDQEDKLLRDFWDYIHDVDPTFSTITFNGVDFDLPFIYKRTMAHRIPIKHHINLRRYATYPHFDVMQQLNNWGFKGKKSQAFYLEMFNIAAKKSGDGSMVYKMYKGGEWGHLCEYCLNDVISLNELFEVIANYYPLKVPDSIDRGRY